MLKLDCCQYFIAIKYNDYDTKCKSTYASMIVISRSINLLTDRWFFVSVQMSGIQMYGVAILSFNL